MVCHWVLFVTVGVGGKDSWGREVEHHAAFFCADDGLIASTDPVWLQVVSDTLTGLFYKVGLRKKVGKAFGVIYRSFCAAGTQLDASYEWRVVGEGLTYQARQWIRV